MGRLRPYADLNVSRGQPPRFGRMVGRIHAKKASPEGHMMHQSRRAPRIWHQQLFDFKGMADFGALDWNLVGSGPEGGSEYIWLVGHRYLVRTLLRDHVLGQGRTRPFRA